MEHAATEILLNIFRHIDDGSTLLDCVSLVCARWNSVAKDPRTWAGVRVTISTSKDHFYLVRVADARVAVRAPALRELTLQVGASTLFQVPTTTSTHVALEKVLTRCRATIEKISCGDSYNMKPDSRTALYALLKRNKTSLRALSSNVRGHVRLHGEMLRSMSSLEHLEELTLEANSRPQYARELKARLPSLRVLVYSVPPPVERVPANHRGILQDLLEGAADSLRRVDIDLPLHASVVQSLSKCVKVTRLTLHVGHVRDVSAIHQMASLRQLTAVLHSLDGLPLDSEALTTGSLPPLRQLKFVTPNSVRNTDVTNCGALLLAIGRAAPNVKRLIVENSSTAAMEKHVEELLSILPDLTNVSLTYGGPSIVPRLLALERLERVWVGDLRVSAYHMKECCDSLQELKRLRPCISGSVNVTPIRVEPRKFVWSKPRKPVNGEL